MFIPMIIFTITISNSKSRCVLYENGLIVNVHEPINTPLGGIHLGKREIPYEHISSIHPGMATVGKKQYFISLGLLLHLPDENHKKICSWIHFSGKKIKKLPEVISIVKLRMGTEWDIKYKRTDPVYCGPEPSPNIPLMVEQGLHRM